MAGGEERKKRKRILRLVINKTEISRNKIETEQTKGKKINKTLGKGIMIIKQKMADSMLLL